MRSAAEHWGLRNGVVEVVDVRVAPQGRLWLDAAATLNGDEKRELLVSSVLSLHSGTEVEGSIDVADGLLTPSRATFPVLPAGLVEGATRACARKAEAAANSFRASMSRRFERDRARIEGYFEDLMSELGKRSAKGRLDRDAAADKQRAMTADRAAKLDALAARFVLRIEVMPIALRAVEVSGGVVTLALRRRKEKRMIELEYDAATRRIVPPPCEACGGSALRPAACDDAVHLLCELCAPRAEGRIACPSCRKTAHARVALASHP